MDINTFILKYVVKREQSLFAQDILDNRSQLYEKIKDKSVLVIGGAGSIGSSFIKQILPYEPKIFHRIMLHTQWTMHRKSLKKCLSIGADLTLWQTFRHINMCEVKRMFIP